MRGTMMDFPLTLATILDRAGKQFAKVEIVSRRPDRSVLRTNYRALSVRARRLASALTGSIFRSALRGRDSAHAEFTAAPERDRDHCESRGRPILAD